MLTEKKNEIRKLSATRLNLFFKSYLIKKRKMEKKFHEVILTKREQLLRENQPVPHKVEFKKKLVKFESEEIMRKV